MSNGLMVNMGNHFGNGWENIYSGSSSSGALAGSNSANSSIFSSGTRNASSTDASRLSNNIKYLYESTLEQIYTYAHNGRTDYALGMYNDLVKDVAEYLENEGCSYNESNIASMISNAYKNMYGESLVAGLTANSKGSFAAGFSEGIPFLGLTQNGLSNNDIMAELSGQDTKFTADLTETAGAATGGALTGAAVQAAISIPWIVGTCASGVALGAAAAACLPAVAAAAGIGAVIGLANRFFKQAERS